MLATIPDAPLLESLRRHRGHGRDDYPVTVLATAPRHEGTRGKMRLSSVDQALRQKLTV